MDMEIRCDSVTIGGGPRSTLILSIEGADLHEILSHIDISDIIREYGESDLLDQIGKASAANHFGLTNE